MVGDVKVENFRSRRREARNGTRCWRAEESDPGWSGSLINES